MRASTPDASQPVDRLPRGHAAARRVRLRLLRRAMGRACYYPALGESRDDIPEPGSAAAELRVGRLLVQRPPRLLRRSGSAAGRAHGLCEQHVRGGLPRFQVTTRDGLLCTTLELGIGGGNIPIVGPAPYSKAMAWRAPCDGRADAVRAIGGLGAVTLSPLRHPDGNSRFDIHLALFFDSGTGIAERRADRRRDLAVGAHCDAGGCPACGSTCSFDTTYHYGYTAGASDSGTTSILSPTVSFTHVRTPTTTMPADQSFAPRLPSCGDAAIDAGDAIAALLDADVQDAFQRSKGPATTPLYGTRSARLRRTGLRDHARRRRRRLPGRRTVPTRRADFSVHADSGRPEPAGDRADGARQATAGRPDLSIAVGAVAGHDEDGTAGSAYDQLGDAAEQRPANPRSAVCSHDDEIGRRPGVRRN